MLAVQMAGESRRYRTESKSNCRDSIGKSIARVFDNRTYPNDFPGLECSQFGPPKSDSADHMVFDEGYKLIDRYILNACVGQGAFGKVISAYDTMEKHEFAIKIIRNVQKYRDSSRYEIYVLSYLSRFGKRNKHVIDLVDHFNFFGHACIVFEKYGKSVYEFMKSNQFRPFPITQARKISYQLIDGITHLHSLNIIHTDLKPENMILVNDQFENIINSDTKSVEKRLKQADIKIIDFGNAVFADDYHSKVICTRHYRPPEVILELPWEEKVDTWSAGCILFEIYTGITMFQAHSNTLHLALIEEILGPIPSSMISRTKKQKYFYRDAFDWNALDREERHKVSKVRPLSEYFYMQCKDDHDFHHLLARMLELCPRYRRSIGRFLDFEFLL